MGLLMTIRIKLLSMLMTMHTLIMIICLIMLSELHAHTHEHVDTAHEMLSWSMPISARMTVSENMIMLMSICMSARMLSIRAHTLMIMTMSTSMIQPPPSRGRRLDFNDTI